MTLDKPKIRFLSIRGAIVAGAFGGLMFGINFGLQALVALFQIPGATGFLSGLSVPFFLALACQINREWGTATMAWTLYSVLAIATLLMGPPGPYKAVLGFLGGAAYDFGYCISGCRSSFLYLGLILYGVVLNIGFYCVWALGLVPSIPQDQVLMILAAVTIVFCLEGILSTWFAIRIYERRVRELLQ